MKKLLLVIALIISANAYSQNRYVVYFTDKNNTPYSLSNPLAYLTQRSIDRRVKQNIAIDSLDLPVNATYIQGVIATGATVLNISKWLNTATIQVTDTNMLAAVNALPYIKITTHVGRPANSNNLPLNKSKDKFAMESGSAIPYSTPNKTSSLLSYGYSAHQCQMLNGDALHDAGFQGDGMMISMMDAGYINADISPVFDSLHLQNKIKATWNFVNSTTDVFTDHWHGAMCFSIIGANSPGVLIGTCPHADYLLLETEESPGENVIEEYNWASGAEFADSMGVDVTTTSLGYTLFDDPTENHSYSTLDGNTAPMSIAADIAVSRGIIVVNSAGNEGNSSWNYISVPSDANDILAIGAVDSAGNYVSFSGNGPTFDGRVKPDVSAQGAGTYFWNPNGYVDSGGGTSFSGPIVAGLAACLWQKFTNRSALEIMDAIRRSASIYNNPDTLIGYGIPNFATASTILAVNEISNNNSFAVYPNPATDVLNIETSKHLNKFSYEITDITGRAIINGKAQQQISVAKLNAGIYFIRISGDGIYEVEKFVKQ
ncbi:MAG: S8/S53 family peptidase [Bacteroidia bacterium]